MDTVTQMLFGATVAQAGFRRRLGRRAMVAGAAIALIPDLDVVVGWVGDTFDTWAWHRGPTHSLFFAFVLGPLLAALIWRWRRARTLEEAETARSWLWLATLVLLTHPLIDLPTSYGTLLLWPITDYRFAWDGLGIIDVAYSLSLVLALAVGAFAAARPRLAQAAAFAAIVFVGAWTLGGLAINGTIEARARADLGPATVVRAYPTLFQPFYRRIVAETPEARLIGFQSVLETGPIAWTSVPRQHHPAIDLVRDTERGRLFTWFALDRVHWTAQARPDGAVQVRGYDTRYGLPGDSLLGFWGVEATVRDGAVLEEVTEFRQRPEATGPRLRGFIAEAFGRTAP